MANLETQKLDSIIASRRALLLGGSALAAVALTGTREVSAATLTDADVLNFALNLEYLEAQFYTLATEGVTADKSTLGGAIATGAKPGTVTVKANSKVPFASNTIQAYALETAREERNHVTFLRTALNTGAVDQPNLDLQNSFAALGSLIGVPGFDPFLNDLYFLLGAYIFEDVGVTAYHGGAGVLTDKNNLLAGVRIHAVEAYHAGLVRVSLAGIDQGAITIPGLTVTPGSVAPLTVAISNLRAKLDGTLGVDVTAGDAVGLTGQDDFGLTTITVPLTGTPGPATTIMDTGRVSAPFFSNYIGFARTPQQVLNIVYADTTLKQVHGGFFPNGLNGTIN